MLKNCRDWVMRALDLDKPFTLLPQKFEIQTKHFLPGYLLFEL